ncbi:hypothetical protein [Microvirga splendida]|uniref:Uncharacterized protein n=1 Tax=Microvirga splendida TaxID=2795727 RepID=A0ABS0Y7N9_9HYPH|nr:hypothetical protein [Microvirga splendida]MBJ6128316.1 hypothetical protein [Microvirga splendida]
MKSRGLMIIVAALTAFSAPPALAHDWYPAACCSQRDCRHLEEADGETVLEIPGGWQLWDGRIVPRGTAKLSPDRLFHLCELPDRRIICFFAPPGAS